MVMAVQNETGMTAGAAPLSVAAMPIDESCAFVPLNLAILTVSDTRGPDDDRSGDTLAARATAAGHSIAARTIVRDDVQALAAQFAAWIDDPGIDAIISTGGTGVTGRDVTPEALEQVAEKLIPGFGELFRWLSYQSIGTSTIQSRACAGVARGTYIFCLPGSTGAVKDGWDGILKDQLDARHRPCNFVELMPRLQER
jgi:molybdenum cofactor biosynthesis protein B